MREKGLEVGGSAVLVDQEKHEEGQPIDSQLVPGLIRSLSQFLTPRIFIILEQFRKSFQTILLLKNCIQRYLDAKKHYIRNFQIIQEKSYVYACACLHGYVHANEQCVSNELRRVPYATPVTFPQVYLQNKILYLSDRSFLSCFYLCCFSDSWAPSRGLSRASLRPRPHSLLDTRALLHPLLIQSSVSSHALPPSTMSPHDEALPPQQTDSSQDNSKLPRLTATSCRECDCGRKSHTSAETTRFVSFPHLCQP